VANYDKAIPPGQEGIIEIAVDGAKVHGHFEKTATVHTNDPDHPVMTIILTGEEVPYVDVTPPGKIYLQGRYGEAVERKVTLASNEEGLDFKVLGVSSNVDDKITYKVDPGEEAGEYQLTIWKNPKLPTLATFGSLYIDTNSENAPKTTLQVQIVTKGAISVQPQTLNYGRVKFEDAGAEARDITKSVNLIKSAGEFEVQGIDIDNENFKADVETLVPGKRYKVNVVFSPPVRKSDRQNEMGEMIIRTNDPTEPSVRVRLVARAL